MGYEMIFRDPLYSNVIFLLMEIHQFFVYILYSNALLKFYIGYTSEPIQLRLEKHLTNHSGFTGKAKDWVIVYFENCTDKPTALRREKEIKSWKSKKKILELIDSK